MLALITFGSIVTFMAFNSLLKQVSIEKVSTSAYVNPIVAMVLGWYVLDTIQRLNWTTYGDLAELKKPLVAIQ